MMLVAAPTFGPAGSRRRRRRVATGRPAGSAAGPTVGRSGQRVHVAGRELQPADIDQEFSRLCNIEPQCPRLSISMSSSRIRILLNGSPDRDQLVTMIWT